MGALIWIALVAFAIISAIKKKKREAQKAAEKARRRATAFETEAPEDASFDGVFPTPEGECAPGHLHSAETKERHVLRPSYETGHAHTEASLSGDADEEEFCPTESGTGAVLQGENSAVITRREELLAALSAAALHAEAQPAANRAASVSVKTAAQPAASVAQPAFRLNAEKMREAVILGEILAKPKALRR